MIIKPRRLGSTLWIGALITALLVLAAPALASESGSGELSTSDPTWNYSGFGSHFYDVVEFNVDTDGLYIISNGTADFDAYFFLYEGSFDPAAPGANRIESNDDRDFGVDLRPLIENVCLDSSTSYILVISSYASGDTGSYTYNISDETGSCDASAGPIAGNLLDGRINRDPAFDVAAPVAVYCNDDGTFTVWAINALSGSGLLVFTSTADQMLAAAPAEQATLSSDGGVWVYRMTDGSFQIHAGYFDGKPYWFSFDTCPPTWTYTTPPA